MATAAVPATAPSTLLVLSCNLLLDAQLVRRLEQHVRLLQIDLGLVLGDGLAQQLDDLHRRVVRALGLVPPLAVAADDLRELRVELHRVDEHVLLAQLEVL